MPAVIQYACAVCALSCFVTKYNGMRYVQGVQEFGGLIAAGLELAVRVPGVISEVAGLFSLNQAAAAYSALEGNPAGKVLVIPTSHRN